MVAPDPWVINPDVITMALKVLAVVVGAVGAVLSFLGLSLIAVLVYIWKKTDGKVDRIAVSLEELTLNTAVRITRIEEGCLQRHANHQRDGDPK